MFFVKIQMGEFDLKINLTDKNVYTTCPKCGKEIQVNLSDLIVDGQVNLSSLRVYCGICTNKKLWSQTEGAVVLATEQIKNELRESIQNADTMDTYTYGER